jgi:hypothetical protein
MPEAVLDAIQLDKLANASSKTKERQTDPAER